MTDRPLITAIVPAFNAARFLPAAIESLRWQEYAPMEILVIDDGSTDDTAEVARSLGPDVRCVRQANAGPSAARNHGLRLARGEFTGFLDADDQWPREKLSIQMARLLAQPDLDAVLGRIQYVALPGAELPGFAFEGEDHTMTHVHLGSGLFHRRAFDKVGYFDESTRFCEDVDWFFRAREESLRMVILRATTLCYRLHDQNMTLDRSSADRLLAAPEFMPTIDRTGLAPMLLRMVIGRCREDLSAAYRLRPGLTVWLDIGAGILANSTLVPDLKSGLEGAGIRAHQLVLGGSDSEALLEAAGVRERLREVRSLGVKLALRRASEMDWRASLVADLGLSAVEIDRRVSEALSCDAGHSVEARAHTESWIGTIVDIARNYGVTVVASGVDTTEQGRRLRALGVGQAHGAAFAPPLSAGSYMALLARSGLDRSEPALQFKPVAA